ncbi:MAG: hypothetical protein ABL995_19880 [Bryobacteraceae bacterium]
MVQGNGSGGGGIRGNRYRLLGPRRNDVQGSEATGNAPKAGPVQSPVRPSPPHPGTAEPKPPVTNPPAATGAPNTAHTAPAKMRVLFVCIGNSCRSQMAEGFAKAYGADIVAARSAGLSPATTIATMTKQVLGEHNIRIDDHFPKGMEIAMREPADLVVNMSGHPLQLRGTRVIEWRVQDPIGMKESVYREVASQIESLVMRLILDLRNSAAGRR